jgi:hypothetical protein
MQSLILELEATCDITRLEHLKQYYSLIKKPDILNCTFVYNLNLGTWSSGICHIAW